MEGEELRKAVLARAAKPSPFRCAECKHEFGTIGEAEKASFTEQGCPACGGSEIELIPGEVPIIDYLDVAPRRAGK